MWTRLSLYGCFFLWCQISMNSFQWSDAVKRSDDAHWQVWFQIFLREFQPCFCQSNLIKKNEFREEWVKVETGLFFNLSQTADGSLTYFVCWQCIQFLQRTIVCNIYSWLDECETEKREATHICLQEDGLWIFNMRFQRWSNGANSLIVCTYCVRKWTGFAF